ncbi:HTH_Tnp_Tc3_2 domain-containing protein [Trichonephila clavipes]|nr:HTH_Tnp_Tc3_2 domain-containing protein [Trichonephila clavipes]
MIHKLLCINYANYTLVDSAELFYGQKLEAINSIVAVVPISKRVTTPELKWSFWSSGMLRAYESEGSEFYASQSVCLRCRKKYLRKKEVARYMANIPKELKLQLGNMGAHYTPVRVIRRNLRHHIGKWDLKLVARWGMVSEKREINNPDDPDQYNGTKLLSYYIVIRPEQIQNTGSIERKREQGPPRATTARKDRHWSILVRRNRETTASQLSGYLYAATGAHVSRVTVSKRLYERVVCQKTRCLCQAPVYKQESPFNMVQTA